MIFSMVNHLQKIIEYLPELIRSTFAIYAVEHLFRVWDKKDRRLLSEDQEQHFHHTVF